MERVEVTNIYNTINKFGEVPELVGTECTIWEGRVHRMRAQSKIIFIVIRQDGYTLQCIYTKKDKTNDPVADYIMNITCESIVIM